MSGGGARLLREKVDQWASLQREYSLCKRLFMRGLRFRSILLNELRLRPKTCRAEVVTSVLVGYVHLETGKRPVLLYTDLVVLRWWTKL